MSGAVTAVLVMEKYAVTAIACIVVEAEISGGEEESGEEGGGVGVSQVTLH